MTATRLPDWAAPYYPPTDSRSVRMMDIEAIRKECPPFPKIRGIEATQMVIDECADPRAIYMVQGNQVAKLDNIGKTLRGVLEEEILGGQFLQQVLAAVKASAKDPDQMQRVVNHLESIIERLNKEQGGATELREKVKQLEVQLEHASRVKREAHEAIESNRKILIAEWGAKVRTLEASLAAAEEEIGPRRLQAKVREQWPTIESELQYFLEWLIEKKGFIRVSEDGASTVVRFNGVDSGKMVAEYVEETKKD